MSHTINLLRPQFLKIIEVEYVENKKLKRDYLNCLRCGKLLNGRADQKYCSDACKQATYRERKLK